MAFKLKGYTSEYQKTMQGGDKCRLEITAFLARMEKVFTIPFRLMGTKNFNFFTI